MNMNKYSDELFDLFDKKLNEEVKSLKPDEGTFICSGSVGAIECGDHLLIEVLFDKKTLKVIDASAKTFGCGSAITSSELLISMIKGKHVSEIRALTEFANKQIAEKLSLPPAKIHCSLLARDSILAVLEDFDKKIKEVNPELDPEVAI